MTLCTRVCSRRGSITLHDARLAGWNYYHCNIDETEVLALADAFETKGLKAVGYEYINLCVPPSLPLSSKLIEERDCPPVRTRRHCCPAC